MGKDLGKDYYYSSWDDFREWAEKQNWYLIIYDPAHPLFVTPTGEIIQVIVGDDDYIKGIERQKESAL